MNIIYIIYFYICLTDLKGFYAKLLILLAVIYHASVVIASVIPASPIIEEIVGKEVAGHVFFDKLLHFIGYSILVFMWRWALLARLKSFALAAATGLILEFIQLAIPWREFSIDDLAFSYLGASTVFVPTLVKRMSGSS